MAATDTIIRGVAKTTKGNCRTGQKHRDRQTVIFPAPSQKIQFRNKQKRDSTWPMLIGKNNNEAKLIGQHVQETRKS